ncbi:MAG: LPS-assembly protein LptD [Candidatus Latescibacteria bacterium]|jgi:lipopolysaccharide assembly outer membrane protein LptD (OstA)|nr:LPS-assembly protein LptD [Candidatus Latescibacterota bacterium]
MKVLKYISPLIFFVASNFFPAEVLSGENYDKTLIFKGFALVDSLEYSAETIKYKYEERKIIFTGNATVSYLGNILKSHEITYYQDYFYMFAVGREDSSGVLVDTPVFVDSSGEELKGEVIKYNIETQKGYVSRGRTQYENGYMSAEKIKRAANDTLFIANGTYTTCDLNELPHYYFSGKKMKFIVNDKIIIKPIVAYIHDIPVFWFPFYVFPIKKGRQSGFLIPQYGSSRRDGRYLSNIGYYLAMSDYTDYKVAGTLRERNGWVAKNWFNYNKKYKMSGSIFGSVEHRTLRGNDTRQWKLRAAHRQTVSPTMSISGSGRFESSTYSQYNSQNLYERLNRDMRSTLTATKRWKESGNSIITNMGYSKNLDSESTETTLPNISFRKSRKLLFDPGIQKKSARKYTKLSTAPEKSSWYNNIYYNFDARFNNKNTKREDSSDYLRQLNMSSNLSSSHKLMGWLITEPSLRINESLAISSAKIRTERYSRQDNVSMGMSLNTTMYGMFQPRIGRLTALRHVVKPSIKYHYGKTRSLTGEDTETLYRFDKTDEKNDPSKRMTMSLRNIFQAKTVNGDKENKFDLFTVNFSSSVNFDREKRKVAPLQTTLDFRPLKVITTRLTASHDFYQDDDSFELFNPYLNNLNLTTNVGLSGGSLGFTSISSRGNVNASLGRDDFDMGMNRIDSGREELSTPSSMPFRLSFSHMYGIRRRSLVGKDKYTKTHNIKPNITFSPSRNFSMRYYCYYDIEKKNLVDHRISISRDLHCWEAKISWIPSGRREGFYCIVNIKELPDVKIERRRGASGIGY